MDSGAYKSVNWFFMDCGVLQYKSFNWFFYGQGCALKVVTDFMMDSGAI